MVAVRSKTARLIVTAHLGFKCDSALLKHELAYCLGQIGNEKALPVLETVLGDMDEDPMVRHEVRVPHVSLLLTHIVYFI